MDKLSEDEMEEVRRGPWTVEEDLTLINYIAHHGEAARWNSLARSAGLKRTGKSCRLRWLNYLRPDVRRGNITLEEQLLILDLHSRWGNRWSKIAQHLPGRTDNEIKNYWRTRVQKHANHLNCDVNSNQFKDTMRYLWMPRLVERIQASAATAPPPNPSSFIKTSCSMNNNNINIHQQQLDHGAVVTSSSEDQDQMMLPVLLTCCTLESSSAISILESSMAGTPVSESEDQISINCTDQQQEDYQYHPMAAGGYDEAMNNNHPWLQEGTGTGDDHALWNNIDDMYWFLQS